MFESQNKSVLIRVISGKKNYSSKDFSRSFTIEGLRS